jgi:hypothetical protein
MDRMRRKEEGGRRKDGENIRVEQSYEGLGNLGITR